MLLDTGLGRCLVLSETAVEQHEIALALWKDSSVFSGLVKNEDGSTFRYPYWVNLLLEGSSGSIETVVVKTDRIIGAIGPSLLHDRRITIDVVKGGLAEIDWIPLPNHRARNRRRRYRPEPPDDFNWPLPWTSLKVKDRTDTWRPLTVNVDSGDSGELSLPPSRVKQFGLSLPDRCWIETTDGPFHARCGDARIFWLGKPLTVKCVERKEENPPLIGMKLLRRKRIIIDLESLGPWDPFAPMVHIAPIPLITWLKYRLRPFASRLRNWSPQK